MEGIEIAIAQITIGATQYLKNALNLSNFQTQVVGGLVAVVAYILIVVVPNAAPELLQFTEPLVSLLRYVTIPGQVGLIMDVVSKARK